MRKCSVEKEAQNCGDLALGNSLWCKLDRGFYPYALHLFLSKVVCPAFIATALYWLQLQGKETYTCHLKYPDAGQTSWEDMLKHFCLFSSENVYLLQFWNFHGSWGKETEDNEMKERLFSFNQAVTQTFRNYLVLPLSQEPRDHRWE